MVNRRTFLQLTLAGLAAAAAPEAIAQSVKKHAAKAAPVKHRPLGLQLYTIREQAEKDLPLVLKALHQIGYKEIELYWDVYNHPAKELRKMLADNNLTAPSGHFNYEGFDTRVDYASELGVKYVICPMLPKSMWTSLDGFREASDQLNLWGAEIRNRGMQFGFHNHNYEFRNFEGTTGWDILMERTDPKLVCWEMDCYWITQAGQDPVAMMNKHADRVRMLHLKDRLPGFPTSQTLDDSAEHFTEVGAGTLNWKAILADATTVGIEHLFVERDNGTTPAIDSLRISFNNLQKLL